MKVFILLAVIGYSFGQECGSKPEHPPWEPEDINSYERITDSGETYIVDGRDAPGAGYWPWQLSLQFLRNGTEDDFRHTCGAVFIDENWALCAAHCVESNLIGIPNDDRREDPENFKLIFGAYNISDITDEQILDIDLIVKHERWVPDPYKGYPNDIALLRLSSIPNLEDERIEMACIPKDTNFNFTANDDCWITGWGKVDWRDDWIPDILQEANIEIPSNEWCFDAHLGYIRDTHICAGTGSPNACSGDSGGPMSCQVDDVWYVAGVTSWGVATCNTLPGVYTRVSKYWEWIDIQMALNAP